MLSAEEIRRNSVVEITSRELYSNNKPVIGGLFDPRMGVLERDMICPTDGLGYMETPGYFGHIELARPVFFIQHIKDIKKICICVCFKCSKLLIGKKSNEHMLEWSSEKRWDTVSKLAASVKRCGDSNENGCGYKQPDKIKLEGMASIFAEWSNIDSSLSAASQQTVRMKLSPEMILKNFRRICDDDIVFMGFHPLWSRPEWMICQVLPVPPPAIRPFVKHDAQQRSEDDLTHIYCTIFKNNQILADKMAQPNVNVNIIESMTQLLQYYIAIVVNNKIKGISPMAQRSGRPLQCIMSRINTKTGRIRGNLMGKRVDFSARTVITGDPNLSIRQLGVPLKIAINITKPETVNQRNIEFLTVLVRHGADKYPGAKILERKNGDTISLRHVNTAKVVLAKGDVVHRHMLDGDVVLFNRQPSLHRMSMMAHIVKVMMVGDTFRMNVGDTKPYNADFDGDEMNMHMPQNELAEIELRHLAAVPLQQLSPTGNSPIIGIFQDSLLGSFQFTRPGVNMSPRTAMNLLMRFPRIDTDRLDRCGETVTSFDVLSQILPAMSMLAKNKSFREGEEDEKTSNNVLEIQNGKFVRGKLDKDLLGKPTRGILHRIHNDFGANACAHFNDDLQNIVTEYMKTCSFSVGISDLVARTKTYMEIDDILRTKKNEVDEFIDSVHLGMFENDTTGTRMDAFEMKINNILNRANDETGKKVTEAIDGHNNRFVTIVDSGSKGSALNISQMVACVGQQNVDGKRIPYGYDDRTLPYFTKFDDSPAARGFVVNSYISGLTAPELFFHAMGGREGLIDTAVKTAQTGYIQRRLIKGLEDLVVMYDMTVRNNMGKIVQFAYGDDGFDSTKVENQFLPLVNMTLEEIYLLYDIAGQKQSQLFTPGVKRKLDMDKIKSKCSEYTAKMIAWRDYVVLDVFRSTNDNIVRIPVSFVSIINNIRGQLDLLVQHDLGDDYDNGGGGGGDTDGYERGGNEQQQQQQQRMSARVLVDLDPLDAFEMIETAFQTLNCIPYAKSNRLFEIMYFFFLNPTDLIYKKRFTRRALQLALETINLKFREAIVHPGEMVGVIAGQSIGEPTTQLTLNSVNYETLILVRDARGNLDRVMIGEFVETQMRRVLGRDPRRLISNKKRKHSAISDVDDVDDVDDAHAREGGEENKR